MQFLCLDITSDSYWAKFIDLELCFLTVFLNHKR